MKYKRDYNNERALFIKNGEWFVNARMCELVTHPLSRSCKPLRVFRSKSKRLGGDSYYVYSEPVWVDRQGHVFTARWVSYAHTRNIAAQQARFLSQFVDRNVSFKYLRRYIRYPALIWNKLFKASLSPMFRALLEHNKRYLDRPKAPSRLARVNSKARKLTRQVSKALKLVRRNRARESSTSQVRTQQNININTIST